MNVNYPHTIENQHGEKLIFHGVKKGADGEKLIVENFITPGSGPVMHTHWHQDEQLTVLEGRIGFQEQGKPEQFAGVGETVYFKRGVPHRFWNAGQDTLHCEGWVSPANSLVFFLSSLYAAQNKTGTAKPETFDGAYLMTRYASEYDLPEIPKFVKKTIIPMTYQLGKLLGKYKHFVGAPEPLK